MVLGPTASGKTDLAIAIAKKFRGEIISIDSRQMYRGLEIGAAIPSGKWAKRGSRRVFVVDGVPHHLLAFRSPAKPLTAAEVKEQAVAAARDIVRRKRLPIFCGGTGLYADAISRNFAIPEVEPDPVFRAQLAKRGTAELFAELRKKDAAYAERISPQNRRYITRAFEVMAATGRKFSEQQAEGQALFRFLKIGVSRPRIELYRRIDRRVDAMMAAGLLEEARKLGRRYGWDGQVMTSLGHRQLGQFLRGEIALEEAIGLIKKLTRHYAKRQLTWFKRDSGICWVKNRAAAFRSVSDFLKG